MGRSACFSCVFYSTGKGGGVAHGPTRRFYFVFYISLAFIFFSVCFRVLCFELRLRSVRQVAARGASLLVLAALLFCLRRVTLLFCILLRFVFFCFCLCTARWVPAEVEEGISVRAIGGRADAAELCPWRIAARQGAPTPLPQWAVAGRFWRGGSSCFYGCSGVGQQLLRVGQHWRCESRSLRHRGLAVAEPLLCGCHGFCGAFPCLLAHHAAKLPWHERGPWRPPASGTGSPLNSVGRDSVACMGAEARHPARVMRCPANAFRTARGLNDDRRPLPPHRPAHRPSHSASSGA
ncbi:hypothetical protein TraAM80_10402 [Trypanosoma rangeli]|uniref:Uncharacterized protein n=1 Tax=Trypanosoma rangeli TaxID=5698 RepID=A0A3R7MTP6_TRYRA|nr:uncharacterized protein TraAM80_10402 [Trypanosoma rangeli]RNE95109.1 hypothetical protein TraAM80_10402 [Trypanosoma rangeli]|eukprot:RNE95109.1 hypothetical protein TraAM80_10402 [Trypanosoma rangeli]